MNKKDTNKNILIGVVVIIAIFLAYEFLIPSKKVGSSKSTTSTTQKTTTTTNAALYNSENKNVVDVELLRKKLDGVKVDTSLFSEKDFINLEDYRKTIQPQPVGRSNPFAKTL